MGVASWKEGEGDPGIALELGQLRAHGGVRGIHGEGSLGVRVWVVQEGSLRQCRFGGLESGSAVLRPGNGLGFACGTYSRMEGAKDLGQTW